jgi:DNA gyrase subunit A
LVAAYALTADTQMAVYTTDGRCVIFSTAQLLPKTTRNTQGVSIVSLKKKAAVSSAVPAETSGIVNLSRYRTRTLPSAGALVKEEDAQEKQIQFEV